MKIIKLKKVAKEKIGHIISNDVNLEPHEYKTVILLAEYGFNIELLKPSNTPKTKNPDILMLGTAWEMKGPTSINESTIKKRFRKAAKQSGGRAIFDLRFIRGNYEDVQKFILKLFRSTRSMRRIIIIVETDNVLDARK